MLTNNTGPTLRGVILCDWDIVAPPWGVIVWVWLSTPCWLYRGVVASYPAWNQIELYVTYFIYRGSANVEVLYKQAR